MTHALDLAGMSAIGYIRVSTEEQAREKQTSLSDQRAAIELLAARLGVTLGHVFEDAGVSGATMEHRPGLRSLIASCEQSPRRGVPAFVLVLNDSRWGRFDRSEYATYWRVHVEKRGWSVRFSEHDETQDDTVRPILRAIVQSQASHYRKTLSANVRRGARGQAEQGYWQGMAPFGFARQVVYPVDRTRVLADGVPKATDEKVILTPAPSAAAIVVGIFERYVRGGESLASLLEWAQRAYPSRDWTRAALHRMLTNPAYVGDVVWGRVSVEPGRRSTRSSAEWYGKRDAHAAIVPRDLFEAASARISSNRQRTRGVRSDWILSGIVRCRCGRGFTGAGETGFGPAYACSSRGALRGRRCSYPGAVLQKLLEGAAINVLAAEIGSSVHRRVLAAAIDQALAEASTSSRSADDVARELEAIRQKQRRLVRSIEEDVITAGEASARMDDLRRDADRLERELVSIETKAGGVSQRAWRDQLVTAALDFRTMASTLKGPALRDLIQLWLKGAEFNTETRELTMEIRRVPAIASGLFVTEGEPSATKGRRFSATVTRKVIVGRRSA